MAIFPLDPEPRNTPLVFKEDKEGSHILNLVEALIERLMERGDLSCVLVIESKMKLNSGPTLIHMALAPETMTEPEVVDLLKRVLSGKEV